MRLDHWFQIMIGKIRRHVWWFAFRHAARFDFAFVAAWLLTLAVVNDRSRATAPGAVKILLLSKRGLFEDAATAFEDDPRFETWYLDMVEIKPFKAMVSAFLPPEIDDFNYLSDNPDIEAGKMCYRDFAKRVLRRLLNRTRFDAVLTASFSYYAEREVAAAFESLSVPFIALHKENFKTPGIFKFYEEVYRTRRGPFHGRRILVYNGIEKDLQVSAGIAPDDCVTVTGMPRLDRIHRWRQGQGQSPGIDSPSPLPEQQVLFFSFGPKTGLPRMARKLGFGVPGGLEQFGDERDRLSWKHLAESYLRAAVRVARRMPDARVIVKAKPVPIEVSEIQTMLVRDGPLPDNLTLITTGDPMDLILGSAVVSGFSTTALLEVIAAGKPLVVPRYGEARDANLADFVVDIGDAAEQADSEDDLVERICRHVALQSAPMLDLGTPEIATLKRWAGNSDGNAGARVADAVLAEILDQSTIGHV